MKECAALFVSLFGGPHDGECVVMSPLPGVGPPRRLTYGTGDFQVHDVYEIWPPVAVWPEESEAESIEVPHHERGTLNILAVKARANHVGKMRMTLEEIK